MQRQLDSFWNELLLYPHLTLSLGRKYDKMMYL